MKNHKDICIASSVDWTREQINEYIYKRMSEGNPSILDLKNKEWSVQPINHIRAIAEFREPFKASQCSIGNLCCGYCTRRCWHRCIQDTLSRVSMEYMSGNRAVRTIMSDPKNWTYDILLETVNSLCHRPPMNYAPQPVYYTNPKSGKTHRLTNADTGSIIFREWPETGLCPYCLPSTTIIRHNIYHKR